MKKGDELVFAVNPEGNDAWDGGRLSVTITPETQNLLQSVLTAAKKTVLEVIKPGLRIKPVIVAEEPKEAPAAQQVNEPDTADTPETPETTEQQKPAAEETAVKEPEQQASEAAAGKDAVQPQEPASQEEKEKAKPEAAEAQEKSETELPTESGQEDAMLPEPQELLPAQEEPDELDLEPIPEEEPEPSQQPEPTEEG